MKRESTSATCCVKMKLSLPAISSLVLAQLDDGLSSLFEIVRASDEDDCQRKKRRKQILEAAQKA